MSLSVDSLFTTKEALLKKWAPVQLLIRGAAPSLQLPFQLELYIGDILRMTENNLCVVAGVCLLAAIAYIGYSVKRSVRLGSWVRVSILLALLPVVPAAPFILFAAYGPLQSSISHFSCSFIGVLGFFKWIELICGTGPKGFDMSAKNFALYFASPAEVLFDAEGQLARAPAGRIWELIQRIVGHAAVLLVSLSLGHATAWKPFLDPGADIVGMPLLGFPFSLPAVYLQTVQIYTMLATSMFVHRLCLALAGFETLDSMRQPLLLSLSIKEFWGRRWNLVIHSLMRRSFFAPLAKRGMALRYVGALLAFIMSGLFHEYMWLVTNWYQMDTYTVGFPVLFFLIQFVLTALESILAKTQVGQKIAALPGPVRTICTTLAILPFGPIFQQGLYGMMLESTAIFPSLRMQTA